jgi:hypothetical protein
MNLTWYAWILVALTPEGWTALKIVQEWSVSEVIKAILSVVQFFEVKINQNADIISFDFEFHFLHHS